jgi:succinate dehydrogenase/fumarate reductase flavoprotein subunit
LELPAEADVVVVGSGASALTAALAASSKGADVVVLEKSDKYGGSSALSGGQLWIPNNRYQRQAGVRDSKASAFAYLKRLSLGRADEKLIQAFLENAPLALDFLVQSTPLRPRLRSGEPDYHPEWPGASRGGRTLDPGLFDGLLLGRDYRNLRHNPQYHIRGGIHTTSLEFERLMRGEDLSELKDRKPSTVALGEALVAALRRGLLDRKVPVLLFCRAVRLLRTETRITGVEVSVRGGQEEIHSKKAVILAAGGFEWNHSMKIRYLASPSENSAGCPTNTGDGIGMGVNVGAAVSLMEEAWWFTLILKPGEKRGWLSTSERTLPGSIMVNSAGRRFANEAMNYNDLGRVMLSVDPATYERTSIPAYLIFDATHRARYSMVDVRPGASAPKWVARGKTLAELAKKLGIDEVNLDQTVNRFNRYASEGRDPDFHRGESLYDRHWGDPSATNPTLGALAKPPFYGVRVLAGDIGTKGGLRTNAKAQVLNGDGRVIEGLYAAGNNMASVMGPGYAGSGATLGPCLAFGYIAGTSAVSEAKKF